MIKISDLDNTCPNQTTISLMKCKKEIIVPFRKLLCLVRKFPINRIRIKTFFVFQIGWRPFGADRLKRPSIFLRIINILYPIFIFILLLFNYGYEIFICQGKLNVKTDTHVFILFFILIKIGRIIFYLDNNNINYYYNNYNSI